MQAFYSTERHPNKITVELKIYIWESKKIDWENNQTRCIICV